MAHPIVIGIRELLITQAADAWQGTDPATIIDSEYLRGQAELIANSTGAFENENFDAPLEIRDEILRRLASA